MIAVLNLNQQQNGDRTFKNQTNRTFNSQNDRSFNVYKMKMIALSTAKAIAVLRFNKTAIALQNLFIRLDPQIKTDDILLRLDLHPKLLFQWNYCLAECFDIH